MAAQTHVVKRSAVGQPVLTRASAMPAGAGALPGGAGAPQWDPRRGAYIAWQPEQQLWLGWDAATGQWRPLESDPRAGGLDV